MMSSLTANPMRCIRGLAGILLGIAGPVLFVVLEWRTHCLSGCLFDPMPSVWHCALLLMVPLSNIEVLVGAMGAPRWVKQAAMLLRWPALLVPLYYSIVIGPHLQGFALVLSPYLVMEVASRAMQGFAWPVNGPERLEAEMTVSAILVLLPALAVAGWWCLRPWAAACLDEAEPSSSARPGACSPTLLQRRMTMVGGVATVLALGLVELPMVRTYLALRTYASAESVEDGDSAAPDSEIAWLKEERQVAVISRLFHSPQPFSSDGVFDCEGPVDVFGPAVRLMSSWASPAAVWRSFTMMHHTRWGELLDEVRTSNPAMDTSPRAWRGLSPWEEPVRR